MNTSRLAKITMVLGLSALSLLVAFNNVIDYNSNYEFVRHVLSMDTTFPSNKAMYRAITDFRLWHLAYAALILGEALTGLLLLFGAIQMIQTMRGASQIFHDSKKLVIAGVTLAFLIWFVGFTVVGGEWFLMWQSPTWNGQTAAFHFYMTMLAVLIFVNQPERD